MDFSSQLNVAAGLASLGLGAGVAASSPRRRRELVFAGLCAAVALWSLSAAVATALDAPDWRLPSLLGAALAPPLALLLTLDVAGSLGRRKALLAVAFAGALALVACSFTPLRHDPPAWAAARAAIMAPTLAAALWTLGRHLRAARGGRSRALGLLIAAAAAALLAALSDLVPRDGWDVPRVGGAALLVLLLLMAVVLARHSFLEVDAFLTRALALVAGAGLAAAALHAVASLTDSFLPLLAATIVVLALVGPVGRVLVSGARTLVASEDVLAAVLRDVSLDLPSARSAAEAWRVLEQARKALPGDVRLVVFTRMEAAGPFRATFRSGDGVPPSAVAADAPLPALLAGRREPVTREELEHAEDRGPRDEAALAELDASGLDVAAPLLRGDALMGWLGLGGLPDAAARQRVATALTAVVNQAVASFDRLDALEAARRATALAAVGEMAAGLAHEIRNPLAALRGAAEVLESTKDASRSREMLSVIVEEVDRLARVVGDFLDWARPSAPRQEPVDLAELAEDVLREERLAGAALHAEVHSEPGVPRALGDGDQLRRAVRNLVRNAREAAGPTGRLRVDVSSEGDRVAARFEDDGPGIAEDLVPRLFQPFQTTKPSGTGLGLALVHRVVQAHGGEVRVEPRPGLGAAFTLLLPASARYDR